MSHALKVFISSTMKDLKNERAEVVHRLKGLNFEPLNAESWLPSGGTPWKTIEGYIDECHVFVLILGETYGWIPQAGYGAGSNKSVTHLEFDYARKLGKTICVFRKRIDHPGIRIPEEDEESNLRFHEEVMNWDGGYMRTTFELARDLSENVAKSVCGILANNFVKKSMQSVRRGRFGTQLPYTSEHFDSSSFDLISRKSSSVERSGVLLAGAGISIRAGYPTANTLAAVLLSRLNLSADFEETLSRYRFADIAAAFVAKFGRPTLEDVLVEAMTLVDPPDPTLAHRLAVHLFKYIVTTNYDDMFEAACEAESIPYTVMSSCDDVGEVPDDGLVIFRMDGGISDPVTLIATESDTARIRANSKYWKALLGVLNSEYLTVVGHSLRDPNSKWLLDQRRRDDRSLYVSNSISEFDALVLDRFGLTPNLMDADSFMVERMREAAERSGRRK